MPKRYHPTLEDLPPKHPELETSNDDFLDDLGRKMDLPLTRPEQKAQQQARQEQERIAQDTAPQIKEPFTQTLEHISVAAEKADREARWASLGAENQTLFDQVRKIYGQIGQATLNRQNDPKIDSLRRQAREAHIELEHAYGLFLDGTATAKAFIDVIRMTHQMFEAIERRLSSK